MLAEFAKLAWAETVEEFMDLAAKMPQKCCLSEKQTDYLSRKLQTSRKWAACHKFCFDLGINSTRRGESSNAVLKGALLTSSLSFANYFHLWLRLDDVKFRERLYEDSGDSRLLLPPFAEQKSSRSRFPLILSLMQ